MSSGPTPRPHLAPVASEVPSGEFGPTEPGVSDPLDSSAGDDSGNVPARGTRTGFTTGACAAAAAKAATRCLVQGGRIDRIETTLPNRQVVEFALHRCERDGDRARCGVLKDAGDDPDVTHGVEVVAEVELMDRPDILLVGGPGVGTVTQPGLGLAVGEPAINPVPRRNITEMVREELDRAGIRGRGAQVTIAVPGGEILAARTLNPRLGILGGLSILGTTGIVRPFSTAAFRASVVQAIDVAVARDRRELVFTTGGRSEAYAMALHPHLLEDAFVQVGDFVGVALRHAARRSVRVVRIVAMMGKLSKMASGTMMTHAAGSEVDVGLLADLARSLGASASLRADICEARTARRVQELCAAAGLAGMADAVCRRAAEACGAFVHGQLHLVVQQVDFDGTLLATAEIPVVSEAASPDTPRGEA